MFKSLLSKINLPALWESVKEILRYALLGAISYLLTGGVDLLLGTITLDPQTRLFVSGIVLGALRSVDKYLHELGKETGNETLIGGLTRF